MALFSRIALSWLVMSGLTAGMVVSEATPRSAAPSSSAVEIRGLVTDTDGTPLAGATVEARRNDRTLVAAGTDEQGEFRLVLTRFLETDAEFSEVVLRARRLGYHPAEKRVRVVESWVELELTPAPLPLPGLHVDGGFVRCDGDDEESIGRTLWNTAAERHPGGLDTLGVASYMTARTDTLMVDEPPPAVSGTSHDRVEEGQRGSAPILRIGWNRRLERDGYAFPVRRTDRTGSYASWSYAPVEADFSPHFGTPRFGEAHYLQLLSGGPDGWTVRFCARDTRRPHMEGRLEFDPDTLIRRVEWRFRTGEPDERAGGWAIFPPADPEGTPPPLLPLESLTWRALQDDQAIRRAQWFEGWILAPGDSVPFLPRRPKGDEPEPTSGYPRY